MGIGLHIGPIRWDKGLREEAEAYVAKLLMRSGDITAALDWVVSVPKNRRAWVEVGMKTSPEQFLEFLTQAEATLSSRALVDLKAGLITQISNTSVNHNQAKWAFSEVKQLRATGAKLRQERKGLWLAAVRLARMHDDQKLAQDILTERAHFELAAKNPDGLSHVALEWLRHERTKKVPRPN